MCSHLAGFPLGAGLPDPQSPSSLVSFPITATIPTIKIMDFVIMVTTVSCDIESSSLDTLILMVAAAVNFFDLAADSWQQVLCSVQPVLIVTLTCPGPGLTGLIWFIS